MEIKIQEEKYNHLIGRKEVNVLINHLGEVTPARETIRSKVAAQMNVNLENIVIQSIQGHFGEPFSHVIAHCYDNPEDVYVFEEKYRLKRNQIIEDKENKS